MATMCVNASILMLNKIVGFGIGFEKLSFGWAFMYITFPDNVFCPMFCPRLSFDENEWIEPNHAIIVWQHLLVRSNVRFNQFKFIWLPVTICMYDVCVCLRVSLEHWIFLELCYKIDLAKQLTTMIVSWLFVYVWGIFHLFPFCCSIFHVDQTY